MQSKQTLSMLTRDGVRLDADVYYPTGSGPFPVLLMRQPYGRAIASTVVYAHPVWYASHGYIVVIQDVRGRGTSEGSFDLFRHEQADGFDAVAWAAQLPNSTGEVGMYGFSYQGMTQLYAAAAHPPALKVLAPAMVGYDLYADWAYEQGALLLQAGLGWAIQLAAETARLKCDASAYQRLYAASRQLPLHDATPACPDLLTELAADSFFHDWLAHPQRDDYWQELKPDLTEVDLPMLHVGGWYDPYLRGNLRLYQEQVSQGTQPQQLWIGPWGHIPWSRRVGGLDFGMAANNPVDDLQIRWFDYFLKGIDTGLLAKEPVWLFDLGSHDWQAFSQWPQGEIQSFVLSSSGLAGMIETDGVLSTVAPAPGSAETDAVPDVLVHDPWRPVPSLGGHAGVPAGCFDRAGIDGRSDVLTYTTGPLPEGLAIAGSLQLHLTCQADAPSFDISAVLSRVPPTGQVWHLTQGYCRVDRPSPESALDWQQVTLALQPSCFTLAAGEALRLSISAACFPAYAVNAGTGQAAGESRLMDQRIITLRVNPRQSRLDLPRLEASEPIGEIRFM